MIFLITHETQPGSRLCFMGNQNVFIVFGSVSICSRKNFSPGNILKLCDNVVVLRLIED